MYQIHFILSEKFLKPFSITPYKNDETGTTIIIPFIDISKLLEETRPSDVEPYAGIITPFWCKDIKNYIKIAVQRWYAPRINNKEYTTYNMQKYLEVSVNNEKLRKESLEPIFKLIQELYNANPKEESKFENKVICSKTIKIQKTFKDSVIGWINYVKVTSSDLKMEKPYNKLNPYYYVNKLNFDNMIRLSCIQGSLE